MLMGQEVFLAFVIQIATRVARLLLSGRVLA